MIAYINGQAYIAYEAGARCSILAGAQSLVNGVKLLTNDNYYLTDISGTYITAKESV